MKYVPSFFNLSDYEFKTTIKHENLLHLIPHTYIFNHMSANAYTGGFPFA